ncbi:MAG: hypothetical protein WA831_03230 [Methylovirgula sp.]
MKSFLRGLRGLGIFAGHRNGEIAMANAPNNQSVTVRFKVQDFNPWRAAYNARERGRASAGITESKVFRGIDDPNDVVILQNIADMAKARAWLTSREMVEALQEGGVVTAPSIRFAA